MLGLSAPRAVKIEKHSRVSVNAFLRPIRSAIPPHTKAPTAMPMRLTVAIQAA